MGGLIPAAQFLRMSTDYQQYSLDNQAEAIALYASQHGFMIVRTYCDLPFSAARAHRLCCCATFLGRHPAFPKRIRPLHFWRQRRTRPPTWPVRFFSAAVQ
jgi:hypothetical protein